MNRTALCLALLLLLPAAPGAQRIDAPEADGPLLTVEPAAFRIQPGERKLVFVRVAGVPETGLAAFQIELEYDADAIDVVDPNAGYGVQAFAPLGGSPLCASIRQSPECRDPQWMLTSGGRQAVGTVVGPADGRLTIAYGTMGDTEPVGGDGALAVIAVVGRSHGRAGLSVGRALLADGSDPPGRYGVRLASPGRAERGERPGRSRR